MPAPDPTGYPFPPKNPPPQPAAAEQAPLDAPEPEESDDSDAA